MRWKLLIAVVLLATAAGFVGWLSATIGAFGSAANLARRPLWFFITLIIPLFFVVFSAAFVYRHTARRRKLQAALAAILVTVLTLGTYLVASRLMPQRLAIAQTREVREANSSRLALFRSQSDLFLHRL
jgi:uncharacterized membrane protein